MGSAKGRRNAGRGGSGGPPAYPPALEPREQLELDLPAPVDLAAAVSAYLRHDEERRR